MAGLSRKSSEIGDERSVNLENPLEGAGAMYPPFLAIDWGTTNRRLYRIGDAGKFEALFRDDKGVANLRPDVFPSEIERIRRQFGDLPVLCAGMVGSNRGWIEVPYAPCPTGIDALAAGVIWVEPSRTAIVPGVTWSNGLRCDVMRGEEVQLLGAVEGGLAPPDSVLCQPGTHCKWAWTENGRLDRFVTAITGEIFSLLRRFSLLQPQLAGGVVLDDSFKAGLKDADDGDLLAHLFAVRADAASGSNRIRNPSSYVSGLLIGSDVQRRVRPGDTIYVLSDPGLGELYVAGIQAAGGKAVLLDSDAAFVSGVKNIWSKMA